MSLETYDSPKSELSTNLNALDEYTALQKYISTYRDPKAAAAEEKANEEVKPKKAWQVSFALSS